MLRRLTANIPTFKTLAFKPGLNILVADTTASSSSTDSRNSAGKSTFVEVVHFLLGARADKGSLFAQKDLRTITFELTLDWPPPLGAITVRRQGSDASRVFVAPDPYGDQMGTDIFGQRELALTEWAQLIERNLFGIDRDLPGVSGRTLLSFLMRRVSSNAFNEAHKTSPQQTQADASTNLAYLLGLDSDLASKYKEINAREATRLQLRKAVNDPVFGQIVGKSAELRGQIAITEATVRRLSEEVGSFRLVPQYELLRQRADELTREIRRIANEDAMDRRNLAELESAVAESEEPTTDYLEPVYRELGVLFSSEVRRRYDEVRQFHDSIVRNRQRYLADEITTLRSQLTERESTRRRYGEEQADLLRTLELGGALEVLTSLQQVLAREQASLAALRHRYDAALALEASSRQITASRIELQDRMQSDLLEREPIISESIQLFSYFARALYGQQRSGYLALTPGRTSLKIEPRIDDDGSRGIGNMVIFCFDLAVAVVGHRAGRAPDFLIHDSHLFDGVDDRQTARALQLAAEVTQAENMQYIATMNSDDLTKAERRGFSWQPFALETRLTDAIDSGSLMGFRF